MGNEALVSAADIKLRVTNKVREEIGSLIPDSTIDNIIEEAKKEFLQELKDDVKKIQKAHFEKLMNDNVSFLNSTEYSQKLNIAIRKNLIQHTKEAGFDEYSLIMQEASLASIRHLVEMLRQRGFNIYNF